MNNIRLLFLASAFAVGATTIGSVRAGDLLPALAPDPALLADHDLVKAPGVNSDTILLRFSNAIMNNGAGELHVVAYRDSASPSTVDLSNDTIPAYQRIAQADGSFRDVPVGRLLYHQEHHHFHFDGAARYDLKDVNTGAVVLSSPKVSFCLADVAVVDSTLPGFNKVPIYNSCIENPYATFGEMGISIGWEDIYEKTLMGQAFDVTDLMKLPAHDYILESTTNPDGILFEANPQPRSASVIVRIGAGVPVKIGKSRPGI